jgi:hypothetical protein
MWNVVCGLFCEQLVGDAEGSEDVESVNKRGEGN